MYYSPCGSTFNHNHRNGCLVINATAQNNFFFLIPATMFNLSTCQHIPVEDLVSRQTQKSQGHHTTNCLEKRGKKTRDNCYLLQQYVIGPLSIIRNICQTTLGKCPRNAEENMQAFPQGKETNRASLHPSCNKRCNVLRLSSGQGQSHLAVSGRSLDHKC